jgi:hypothetical protein
MDPSSSRNRRQLPLAAGHFFTRVQAMRIKQRRCPAPRVSEDELDQLVGRAGGLAVLDAAIYAALEGLPWA